MMTTWRLWRALQNPPSQHPIFQRAVLLPDQVKTRRMTSWAGIVVKLVFGLGEYSPTLLPLLIPVILLFIGMTYGLDCAVRVGDAIAKEREQDTFNLLSLSPSGALGTSWVMCTSLLYRNWDFDRLRKVIRASLIIAGSVTFTIALLAMMLNSGLFNRFSPSSITTLVDFISLMIVMAALYIEFVQSTILGTLVGMFVPTYTQSRIDTSLYTFGVFALLQITTYLGSYFIGFVLLPSLYDQMGLSGEYARASLTLLRLGVFYLIRETIISGLWRVLIDRLNAYPSELDLTMQTAP